MPSGRSLRLRNAGPGETNRLPPTSEGAQVDERFRKTTSPEWDVLEEHVVSEVMTQRLCELPPETDVQEAAEFMLRSGIHRVLVTQDSRLVG
jgi:hypothetical protein